ncbi:MAG: hypothetical protein ACYTFW_11385, partial [Planctomycetota bacterium]
KLALFFQISLYFSPYFSADIGQYGWFFGHPEAQPKDLAKNWSKPHRNPDSSFHSEMTNLGNLLKYEGFSILFLPKDVLINNICY